MSVTDLLSSLALKHKAEGNQWLIDCPVCGKVAHCNVDKTTGLWHCFVCGGKGNPYQLARHHRPDATPAELMKLLAAHALADATQKATKKPPKDLSWLRPLIRKPSSDDIRRVCAVRKLDPKALLSFRPMVHKKDPIMFLPASVPGQAKYVGFLRVHLDGKMIETKQGPQKCPILGSWGLLGIWACTTSDSLVFAEGWADALTAIEAGYVATASIGGTGWQDTWPPLFKGKHVIIIPDADTPGVASAEKRAVAIAKVAASVKVVHLPYKVEGKHGLDLRDFLQEGIIGK